MLNFEEYKNVTSFLDQGHAMKVFPLFSKADLAKRWGVSRQTVNNWAARHEDFCKPVYAVVDGPVFYYPLFEVERYENLRGLKGNE